MMHSKISKDQHSAAGGFSDPPRKRVSRACDRCRLKKGKCDGKEQCAKCISADVMCIYTDRKPPQHKLISPVVAEALQSENLTLKKTTVILYKQLMVASHIRLPSIDGVDWDSDKVSLGKSGRALNYIISQQAEVDNRISNEEIADYDSDTQTFDSGSRTCPASPSSHQSSPRSAAGNMWNQHVSFDASFPPASEPVQCKKRKMSMHAAYQLEVPSSMSMLSPTSICGVPQAQSATFEPPLFVQHSPNSLTPTYSTHTSNSPVGIEPLGFMGHSPIPDESHIAWANEQAGFFGNGVEHGAGRFVPHRYADELETVHQQSTTQPSSSPALVYDDPAANTTPWNVSPGSEYYHYMREVSGIREVSDTKDFRKYSRTPSGHSDCTHREY
jgi:hypothetical protein